MTIRLDGHGLTPAALAEIADGAPVSLSQNALDRMARTRGALLAALADGAPIYGVTTGLGNRVTDPLPDDARDTMAADTIRTRAHAAGPPMSARWSRAGLAVRLNTFLGGGAGVDPALARSIAAVLNAGLAPVIPTTGSVGAADLMWGGMLGLALIGEGQMHTETGIQPAAEALASARLDRYTPGPREGLALVSHSCISGAIAALAAHRLSRAMNAAQAAAALSMEAFRSNLSPLDPEVLQLRPQAGQIKAAGQLRTLLKGSTLRDGGGRRLQDPLSLRNVAQIHGAAMFQVETLTTAATDEINGATDNPVVVGDRVAPSGGYLAPHLAISAVATAHACAHLAACQAARCGKHLIERLSGLPAGLGSGRADDPGLAPVMKTAEALAAEIFHLAQSPTIYPSGGADGVEDVVTHAAVSIKALHEIADRLCALSAIELIIADRALEMRAPTVIAPALDRLHRRVRATAPASHGSQAAVIAALSDALAAGTLIEDGAGSGEEAGR